MLAPAALAVVLAAVTVQGATTCPTPQAVDGHLRPLLAAAPAAVGDVRLERDGQLLHVALYARDGRLTARRTLAGPHSCEALAEAAAVIVAAWQGDVGDRSLLAAESPAGAADLRAVAPAPVMPGRSPWGLGLAGGLSLAGTSPAAAAALTIVNASVSDRPWLGRLGVVYQGARESELTTGKLRWQRWTLELGPQLQGALGEVGHRWGWAVHLGGALGLTRLQGIGLADARDLRDVGFGAAGGARLSLGDAGLRPFLELGLSAWPSRLVAYEGGAGQQRAIPRFEGRLTLGGALGR